MSNKPTPITRRAKSSGTTLRRVSIIVVVILLGIAASAFGWHVYQTQAIAADKARFVQAEKDVAEVSRAIIAATGAPLKVESTKTCVRPHMKFNNGPLSCDVDQSLFYEVQDPNVANGRFMSVSQIVRSKMFHKSTTYPSEARKGSEPLESSPTNEQTTREDYQKIIETYQDDKADISCHAVYEFYNSASPPYPEYEVQTKSTYLLGISVNCGDSAKSQYYPMAY